MSTAAAVSVDEFQALEQKVLRAVEIVKKEREARMAAEAEAASLRAELKAQVAAAEERARDARREHEAAESQIAALANEREAVKQRVEKMLEQMDELM